MKFNHEYALESTRKNPFAQLLVKQLQRVEEAKPGGAAAKLAEWESNSDPEWKAAVKLLKGVYDAG